MAANRTVTELMTFARGDLMLGQRGAEPRPLEFLGGSGSAKHCPVLDVSGYR